MLESSQRKSGSFKVVYIMIVRSGIMNNDGSIIYFCQTKLYTGSRKFGVVGWW